MAYVRSALKVWNYVYRRCTGLSWWVHALSYSSQSDSWKNTCTVVSIAKDEEEEGDFMGLVLHYLSLASRKKRRKHQWWGHNLILQQGKNHGASYHLVKEPTSRDACYFGICMSASPQLMYTNHYMVQLVCDFCLMQMHQGFATKVQTILQGGSLSILWVWRPKFQSPYIMAHIWLSL